MTIHFYLDRNKNIKSDERAIYCTIRGIEKGRTINLHTKQRIKPENWDKVNQRSFPVKKSKTPDGYSLNDFLDNYKEQVKTAYRKVVIDNPEATYEDIEKFILNQFGKTKSFTQGLFETLDLFMNLKKKELAPGSLKKYKTIKSHLMGFEDFEKIKLSFRLMDLLFYDKFLNYLIIEKELVNNSAYKIISFLKTFLSWSFERGINRFEYYKKFKVKEDPVESVALKKEELKRLYDLDLSGNERLDRVRDLFVFGCLTGARFSDLTEIEHEDISDGKWRLRVHKTRGLSEIDLYSQALKILKKYEHEKNPLPRISNQKFNAYIKEVCKIAGIDEKIKQTIYHGSEKTTSIKPKYEIVNAHTSRRTFVTIMKRNGMSNQDIMSVTGHNSERTMKKYNIIDKQDTQNAMKDI